MTSTKTLVSTCFCIKTCLTCVLKHHFCQFEAKSESLKWIWNHTQPLRAKLDPLILAGDLLEHSEFAWEFPVQLDYRE